MSEGFPSVRTPNVDATALRPIGRKYREGRRLRRDKADQRQALSGLCLPAGDHFEPATPEERRRLSGIDHLTNQDIDHDKSGWSKRSFQVGPGDYNDAFTIDVHGHFQISVSDLGAANGDRILSINLLRPGYAPQEIWSVDQRYGIVNRAAYQHIFQDRE